MAGTKSLADPRAVVLSRDPAFVPGQLGQVKLVLVASAYEAAADILSAPTVALVVDLRSLSRRHVRLLDIAHQMGCEVLAAGTVPAGMNTSDLHDVRLVAPGQLSEVLAQAAAASDVALHAPLPPDIAVTAPAIDQEYDTPSATADGEDLSSVRHVLAAQMPSSTAERPLSPLPSDTPSSLGEQVRVDGQQPAMTQIEQILSNEELSALREPRR